MCGDKFRGRASRNSFRIFEGDKIRHLHVIQFLRVIGAVAAVFNGGVLSGEEFLRAVNPGDWVQARLGLGVVDFRQAVNLLDVECGIAFHVRNFALGILVGFVIMFGARDGIGEDDK